MNYVPAPAEQDTDEWIIWNNTSNIQQQLQSEHLICEINQLSGEECKQ